MPETKDDKIIFSQNESNAGTCPVCKSEALNYGTFEVVDNSILYPWNCKACGASGKEYGKIVFDGHEVNKFEKELRKSGDE